MTAPQLAEEPSPTSTPPPSGPSSAGPVEGTDGRTGRRAVLVAVLIAAVVGAAALPGHAYGIGWPICAAAVFGAVLTARRFRSPSRSTDHSSEPGAQAAVDAVPAVPAGDRAWRVAAGVAALGLTAVPAIRAAETLAVLCLITAVLLASYSLAGGRTWLGLATGATALVPAAVRALGWSAKEVPVETGSRRIGRITIGIAVGVVLFLIFGTLLAQADPVFADLIGSWLRWLSDVDGGRLLRGLIVIGWLALAAAYQVHRRRPASAHREPRDRARSLAGAEWVIPLVLLDALFAVFVFVQLTVLFGGHDYVLGAGGPDYAYYARGGSGQLGLVTALTLGVVAALAAWARRSSTLDLGLIRALGGILCGLTLVIVASALKRLDLYADAYGFTWPRMLGFAGEVWLGLIFVLVLLAGIRLRASWLPRATVAAAVGVLFALVAVNPEAMMARGVLSRYDGPYGVDFNYLEDLSADSVVELERLPEGVRDCELNIWVYRLREADPWYELNLARENARALVGTEDRCRFSG